MSNRLVRLWRWCEQPESFHVMLFVFLLAGKVWILATGEHPLAGMGPVVRMAWTVLGLACPLMVFAAYALIYGTAGRSRFLGYWLRLGGDAGQLFLLPIFIVGFLTHPMGFSDPEHVFAASLMVPVLVFVTFMTVRDALLLAKVEQLAHMIERRS